MSKEHSLQPRFSWLVGAIAISFTSLLAVAGSSISAEASDTAAPKTTTVRVPVSVSTPRLLLGGEGNGMSSSNGKGRGTFDVMLSLVNAGKEAVTIVGFGRSGPGMKLLLPQRRGPYVVHAGEELGLQLKYRVTDCKAVPRGNWPLPVRVLGSKGEQTLYLKSQFGSQFGKEVPWHLRWVDFCGFSK